MELIERAGFLTSLEKTFNSIGKGEGHCVLVSGEAGIGKTSLVRTFCKQKQKECKIYQGTCDALFTPRPLAPLYDIIWQMHGDSLDNKDNMEDRAGLFNRFFHELSNQPGTTVIVFEDIHWADEATLDFIKFLARRITRIHCLFILTYRDDEILPQHPLRNVLGQLPADSFSRLKLTTLSEEAVKKLSDERGYRGEDVYSISKGNPFYVNEILASYSSGIPDNIKDAVLSVFNRQDDRRKQVWELLSILPTGFEIKYMEKIEPEYAVAVENCIALKILIVQDGLLFFKHELYRRTIESSLSPLKRVALNKRVLDLFHEIFEDHHETERIIHHAKNANEYDSVVYYAPLAARQAASVGAHIEAARLYFTAIEYYQGNDPDKLVELYEAYAYECYLVNRLKEAIIYQGKLLNIRKEKGDPERTGDCLRFLSRLWWFDGNRKKAEGYADEAIAVLKDRPASDAKAMAYSNMSQLKMLADQVAECIYWGEQAITMAKELGNNEILSHALNNVGAVQMKDPLTKEKGIKLIQESLALALKNSYHEHAARAYTNLASDGLKMKEFAFAGKILEEGIKYCEERDLDSWTAYMLSCKARLCLETGLWEEAGSIAENLLKNDNQPLMVEIGALTVQATIALRKGTTDPLPLLQDLDKKAVGTMELQRIIPALVASFEYEWLTGNHFVEQESIDLTLNMMEQMGDIYDNTKFAYWLEKARGREVKLRESFAGYVMHNEATARKAADIWEQAGAAYEQALALFEGDETEKRKAISIVHALGADAVYEKMKQEMRTSGIKSIPRGMRKSTRDNPALLTGRELDVLQLLRENMQNKEIAARLFISAKTVDHHISSILFKLEVNSRAKAAQEAVRLGILK